MLTQEIDKSIVLLSCELFGHMIGQSSPLLRIPDISLFTLFPFFYLILSKFFFTSLFFSSRIHFNSLTPARFRLCRRPTSYSTRRPKRTSVTPTITKGFQLPTFNPSSAGLLGRSLPKIPLGAPRYMFHNISDHLNSNSNPNQSLGQPSG